MPTVAAADTALHGLHLPAGQEVIVDYERAPARVEVVVTVPGSDPVYWAATGRPAQIAAPWCRVIPAGVIAVDSTRATRTAIPGSTLVNAATARVRLICASAVTVSLQEG
jgi:hypothetical protein